MKKEVQILQKIKALNPPTFSTNQNGGIIKLVDFDIPQQPANNPAFMILEHATRG
jgi:hypothetical protein